MRLLRKISAIICLGIIGALTLHDIVPHIHHSHIEFEEGVNSNEHHHSHNHDDQNTDSTEQDFLFPSLVDHHTHSFHTHEFTLLTKIGNPNAINKQLIIVAIVNDYGSPPEHEIQTLLKYALLKQVFFEAPTLLNYDLRGPPSLG